MLRQLDGVLRTSCSSVVCDDSVQFVLSIAALGCWGGRESKTKASMELGYINFSSSILISKATPTSLLEVL